MRTVLSWSSGKDCAWALHVLRSDPAVEVVGLLTTLNQAFDRVAMHGVRREILEAQAEAAGLPLIGIDLPWPCSNEIYEARMRGAIDRLKAERVAAVAFGDLFLEDVRAYREKQMAGSGLQTLYPLWGRDTGALAREMIGAGLQARIATLDPKVMPRELAGAAYDMAFLDALPDGVDPCGENGEFHTCVTAGPMFARALRVGAGEVVERDGFVYADMALVKG